jgi:hypothetical protein
MDFVDWMASALKAEDMVREQNRAGHEGLLERIESPRAFVVRGDKAQMTAVVHRGGGSR